SSSGIKSRRSSIRASSSGNPTGYTCTCPATTSSGTLPDGSATCVPKTISPSPPSSPSPPPTSPSPPSSPSPSPATSSSPSPHAEAPPSVSPPSPPSSSPSSSDSSSSLSLGVIVGPNSAGEFPTPLHLSSSLLRHWQIRYRAQPSLGPPFLPIYDVLQATDSWASYKLFWVKPMLSLSPMYTPVTKLFRRYSLAEVLQETDSRASHCLFRRYSLSEVLQATDNWASYNHLGSGGYGDVYKGVPPSARVGGGGGGVGGVGGMGGVGGESGGAGLAGASVKETARGSERWSGIGSGRGSVWGSKRGRSGEGEVGITVEAGEPQVWAVKRAKIRTNDFHKEVWAVKRAKIRTNDFHKEVWAVKRAKIRTNDFHKEVELMASKHHPHLVRLLGYCVTTDAKTHSSPPAPKHSSLSPPAPPSQVELMASKHHPHLVRLLGYCVSTDAKTHEQEQIIIYEFMENGDLERVLKSELWCMIVCVCVRSCMMGKGAEEWHEQEQIIIYEFMENGDLERVLKSE
ncbi:unnamed protein product, partial [Closterium sp. NIES-53]